MAFDPNQEGALNDQIESTERSLRLSNSAYARNENPSRNDVSLDKRLRSLRSSLNQAQMDRESQRWYGDKAQSTNEAPVLDEEPSQGFVMGAVDALSKPLYAAVGVAKAAAGKGDGGFFNTVNKNIFTNKETFGDLLSDMGAPRAVSVPLGLALDIGIGGAMDPAAFLGATGRYSNTILRTASGLKRGGVEGAKQALKSSVLQKAATGASFIPFLRKSEAAANLGTKAVKAAEAFDSAIGQTVFDAIEANSKNKIFGPALRETVEGYAKKLGPKGEAAWDFFVGPGTSNWYRMQKLKEDMEKSGALNFITANTGREGLTAAMDAAEAAVRGVGNVGDDVLDVAQGAARGLDEAVDVAAPIGRKMLPSVDLAASVVDDIDPVLRPAAADMRATIAEGLQIANEGKNITRAGTPLETVQRMLEETGREYKSADILRFINEYSKDATKFEAYDTMMKNVRKVKIGNVPVLEKMLDTYEIFIGLFKSAKVSALSPSAMVNSVVGNPTMAWMMGLDVVNPDYARNVKKALNVFRGKSSADVLGSILNDPEIGTYMAKNPNVFRQIFGFHPLSMTADQLKDQVITQGGPKMAKLFQENPDVVIAELKAMIETGQLKTGLGTGKEAMKQGSIAKYMADFVKNNGRNPTEAEMPITFGAQFIDYGAFSTFKKEIAAKAAQGNAAAKAMNWMLTKPLEAYELSDQSYRFGTFLHLVQNGVSEGELEKMSRFANIARSDVTGFTPKLGKRMYKLTADKAAEISSEMYMNYAAMPAAVKVLRSVPLIGAPFASFGYGMLGKTMSTIINNPTALTKIGYTMNEIGGQPGPLEKTALDSPQYSWLNDPFMLRLGNFKIFRDNPVYLNTKNWLPFASNILAPSERKWSNTIKGNIGSTLDSIPLMKDPLGAMIMSYFVLPQFLEEGEVVQGQFGQPLYPQDATFLDKAGYATRDVAESVVPGAAGLAGFIPGLNSDAALKMAPSYRWRSIGNALQGKSSEGIGSFQSSERRAEKTIRATAGLAGISLTPVDLDNVKTDE